MAVLATTLIRFLASAVSWAGETPPGQPEGTTQQATNQVDQPATSPAAQPAASQAQSSQPQPVLSPTRSSSRAATRGQYLDDEIAMQLRICNKLRAKICQLVAQRSQNEEVKQFAQTIDRTHSEMIAKLPKSTPGVGQARYDVSSALREIAQRLESTAERREVLGYRGSGAGASAQPGQAVESGQSGQVRSDSDAEKREKRRDELLKIIDQQRAVIRAAQQENRDNRQDNREAAAKQGAAAKQEAAANQRSR